MGTVVEGLPPLTWSNGPGHGEKSGPNSLVLVAAARTDWTNDAFGGQQQHAATSLGFIPTGDFRLSSRVHVEGDRTTFDAAALAIWCDRDHWAKLCFEFSPQRQAMVVSVVTNGYSDDCNSVIVTEGHTFLRVMRAGDGWAFHSSKDGAEWNFVRVFRLDHEGPASVGFLAQAPMGESCVAVFDDIEYRSVVPADLRNGA